MTDELPAQWALDKAAKVAGFHNWSHFLHAFGASDDAYTLAVALARYIEKHEPAPVDPDLELAREICARIFRDDAYLDGSRDLCFSVMAARCVLKERGK